ncbi:MAG: hypothetical protein RMK52_04080 [Chitinophagales bacterium]|nr:hypothetical protein [Chitinophagales bacterium]MDW8393406.1 hypothetical protein [Chitinophagales bacterium]
MTWWHILLILLFGWLLVMLEVFLIPGITLLAVLGALTMVAGVVLAYTHFGVVWGTVALLGTAVFTLLSIVYGFRSGLLGWLTLKSKVEGRMNVIDETRIRVGDRGQALSKIAPAGKGLFGNDTYEVHSLGEWIDEGAELEVIRIALGKIYVKPINKTDN